MDDKRSNNQRNYYQNTVFTSNSQNGEGSVNQKQVNEQRVQNVNFNMHQNGNYGYSKQPNGSMGLYQNNGQNGYVNNASYNGGQQLNQNQQRPMTQEEYVRYVQWQQQRYYQQQQYMEQMQRQKQYQEQMMKQKELMQQQQRQQQKEQQELAQERQHMKNVANQILEEAQEAEANRNQQEGNKGKGFSNLNKKLVKKIALGALAVIIPCTAFGVYQAFFADKSAVHVCESNIDYNKGIGVTFYVGEDGKTIEKIEKNDKVSLDFIKKNLGTENAKEILEEYKQNLQKIYNANVEKNKDLKFFSSKIDVEENSISTSYIFDVSDKSFDYNKYEDLMTEYALNYYYDKEAKSFIYDESKILSKNTPVGGIEDVACRKLEIAKHNVKTVKSRE